MTARAGAVLLSGVLALVGGAIGCGRDYSVVLLLESDPPLEADYARDRVTLPEGIVVGVHARAYEDDEPEDEDVPIDLLSSDTSIVDVRRGLDENDFVLVARAPGTATIDAWVDDESARPIEVVVEAQTPPP